VRITVRAADTIVVREGCGSGEAKAFTLGQAHELALKSAETDATKRALASFGNRFGLALYDPAHAGVRHGGSAKRHGGDERGGPSALMSASGEVVSVFETPQAFGEALRRRMNEALSVDDLFGVWEKMSGPCARCTACIGRILGQLGWTGLRSVPPEGLREALRRLGQGA
jgi:hypothetical protein